MADTSRTVLVSVAVSAVAVSLWLLWASREREPAAVEEQPPTPVKASKQASENVFRSVVADESRRSGAEAASASAASSSIPTASSQSGLYSRVVRSAHHSSRSLSRQPSKYVMTQTDTKYVMITNFVPLNTIAN